jgi:hypothetical protein
MIQVRKSKRTQTARISLIFISVKSVQSVAFYFAVIIVRACSRSSADEPADQPDHAVRHSAVNIEKDGFSLIDRQYREALPVPHDSRRRQASHAAANLRGE